MTEIRGLSSISLALGRTTRNDQAVLWFLEQADCPYRAAGMGDTHCGPLNDDFETARGWQVVGGSRHSVLDVRHDDDSVLDAVRDTVADLGVGLLRLEPRRHGLAEIFADAPAEAADGPEGLPLGGADVG